MNEAQELQDDLYCPGVWYREDGAIIFCDREFAHLGSHEGTLSRPLEGVDPLSAPLEDLIEEETIFTRFTWWEDQYVS